MRPPRIGELFAGYGGLGMGVQAVYGGTMAWVSDIDKGANKVLAHRFPDVPNLGDITTIDWSTVEPVDILTGGSPCQDLSHAGARKGMTDGTRSNLWVAMREAIAQLRPSLVVWENVRGAYSASADSAVEPCPGCMGDGPGQPALRALGRVLGDLSDLGYDTRWHGLRAADVGAPHGRFRVFVAATDASRLRRKAGWTSRPRAADRGRASTHVAGRSDAPLTHLPTPTKRDTKGRNQRKDATCLTGALLPTPRAGDGEKGGPNQRGSSGDLMLPSAAARLLPVVNDMGEGKTVEHWDEWTAKLKASHGNGNGHGPSLSIEAQRLIPTPSVADALGGHERRNGTRGEELLLKGMAKEGHLARWRQYGQSISRWEDINGPAPSPTETGPKGSPRLAAAFSEWLMGMPAGWVTDVPGITRNEALKACGNGVVWQQAAEALRIMHGWRAVA